LIPGGAHLFELPNKIGLSQEQYFAVQAVYRGWAFFGTVIVAAIGANLAVAVILFHRGRRFWPSLAAGLILGGTLVVFFMDHAYRVDTQSHD
jgi:predicted anti-sigma-YlaC factor YlaD